MAKKETKSKLANRVEKKRVRKKSYTLDLRIHTPASLKFLGIDGLQPAPAVVRLAKVKGLDVIAVTDYYSTHLVKEVMQEAEGTKVVVIPGTMVRTCLNNCNDIHLACLFPEKLGAENVNNFLQALSISQDAFGNENYIVKMPFENLLKVIEAYSGIAIPSRMDKTPNRLSVLPALVEDYGFRAFDLAYEDSVMMFKKLWPKINFQFFTFSSATSLAQIGSKTAKVKLRQPTFESIQKVVLGIE